MSNRKRPLKVFLCHDSSDMPRVHELYKALIADGVEAWLEQVQLLPGQDRTIEIPRAVQEADVVVICLSKRSITTEGSIQKEIRFALDVAAEKLEDAIFIIPARLEECEVPRQISRWQGVDLFREGGYQKLISALRTRARKIKVRPPNETAPTIQVPARPSSPDIQKQKMKWAFIGLIALMIAILVFVYATPVWNLISKPVTPTTGPISLSAAKVDFAVTTPTGTQTIPALGVLSLHQADQVNIETRVSGPNDIPYPHDLEIRYFFTSGGDFSGKIAPYTATRQNDVITVQIKDPITGETISRTLLVQIN